MRVRECNSKIRMAILGLVLFGVFGSLGKLVLFPNIQEHKPFSVSAFSFPESIPLSEWRFLASDSIDTSDISNDALFKLISGRTYYYQQKNHQLTVEMVYSFETNGNIANFFENYTSVPPAVAQLSEKHEQFDRQTGYYLLFENQEQVHLASCINPRGKSTITLSQFQRNRYLYDISPKRLFRWFFKSESLRDLRCIWINMYMPLDEERAEQMFLVLENSWLDWHSYWQRRFPNP